MREGEIKIKGLLLPKGLKKGKKLKTNQTNWKVYNRV